MDNTKNSVNVVIQAANGHQQLIKIMRNPNGQPLTQEGFKAIVKEVTGHDTSKVLVGKNTKSRQFVNVSNNSSSSSTIDSKYQDPDAGSRVTTATTSLKSNHQMKQSTSKSSSTGNYSANVHSSSSSAAAAVAAATASTKKQAHQQQHIISRRRKTDRVGKGLRHFSMKVCEKVKEKGTTTYNEVADELVVEEAKGQPIDPANYDQKNIRRRVYDALNVLMAMNIISKDKKEIRWIGLPVNSAQQCHNLEKENQTRKERIEAKQLQLRELILQQVSFKSLVSRNKEQEERGLVPSLSSAIQMPFIIVNTHKKTNINCCISSDKSEYQFKFNDKFEIHDDIEVLKRMGLLLGLDKGECTYDDIERAKTMVPKTFQKYIEIYGRGQDGVLSDDWDMPSMDMMDTSAMGLSTTKIEPMTDDDDIEEDRYTDASDIE